MPVTVRPCRPDEGRVFFDIHTRSIRGLAAPHYPPEVIAAWGAPAIDRGIERFSVNPDGEVRLIAERDGEPVGLGVVVLNNSELRACYVVPEASRQGVGSAIVRETEPIAVASDLSRLDLHASVNAETFYASLGYEVVERSEHVLRSGLRMAAVKMTKSLA